MKKKKDTSIFSGDNSKLLWKDINSIEDEKIHTALYHLGCKCQELEAKLIHITGKE
jgi:hypothetical protein